MKNLAAIIKFFALASILGFSPNHLYASDYEQIHKIQQAWGVANYQLQGDTQLKAFESLLTDIDSQLQASPNDAQLLTWRGITKSSYAGVKGGLGALSLAKASRKDLERAIEIDGKVLDGSAYTSLATLYAQVPGWPIGFGSNKKAKALFAEALKLNPNGIDSNYFFAQFMFDQGNYTTADKHYRLAQQAAARPDRPIADAGRQKEIRMALIQVAEKLR
ncbi:tetratricopeptide repeat protein [Aurantivibrio plasticivorans]